MNINNLIITVVLILVNGIFCNAKILIVDNHTPTPAGAYSTIQLAHDAASAGDTLMLTPSEIEYSGITITKTIHIIGNVWDRPAPDLSFTKTSGFSLNAEGVSIQGIKINGDCFITKNSITLKRNWINGIIRVGYQTARLNGIIIIQNLITGNGGTITSDPIGVKSNSTCLITNNVVKTNIYGNAFVAEFPITIILKNNIFISHVDRAAIYLAANGNSYSNHEVLNNIVISGSIFGTTISNNNLSNSTQFPASNGNIQNIDMNAVFVNVVAGDYHLKAGSPAIGAGENGTDCGIYGGELGFVDKGIPGQPYIYHLEVPSIVNKKDGLSVTVKAKSVK